MGLNRDNLVVFHKPWFTGNPQNAMYAEVTLEFSATPIATENVTIGTEIYEFIANGGTASTPTNFEVELAATPTVDDSIEKLAIAINANSTLVTAVGSDGFDTVTILSKFVGTEGNSITISETLTNAAFLNDATELSGGQYATPCKASSALIEIGGTKYYTEKQVDKWSITGWSTVSSS
jgi:hypothetical protein